MMYFRTFRSRGVYANIDAFRREMRQGIENRFVPVARSEYEKTTRGWKSKPGWETDISVTEDGIYFNMWPTGPEATIWWYLNDGVRQRVITPRNERSRRDPRYPAALKLPPKGRFSRYYHRVVAGEIESRNWVGTIAPQLEEHFRQVCENAARRGITAAQREGR